MKNLILTIAIIAATTILFAGCAKEEVKTEATVETVVVEEGNKPIVTIELEGEKFIDIELYPSIAPNTVNNFISLVENEYYNGIIFHRVIKGFMIQGGDPTGTGSGGPGYSIDGEFSDNGFKNDLVHTKGVISMARTNDPNSGGSQFFLMHEDSPHLDEKYAGFGKVIKGIEFVDEIAEVETGKGDKPLEDVVMKNVTVNLNGYEAQEPIINE